MRRRVMREGNYTCVTCGIIGYEQRFPRGGYGFYTAEKEVYLSIDHIVAKSRGGSGERSNLRILCTPCNTKKGTKDA
jgi:5-methylcytosine-specific restriction endonuclease McrA